jgi:hyperosmotically inducible protein
MSGVLLIAPGLMRASINPPAAGSLEDKVRHEIVMQPYYTVFDDLSYRVDGSVVTLFGAVTDPVLKTNVGKSVKHIEGVTQVNNEIEVLPLSMFDNQIRWRTYQAIFGSAPLQRYGMGVLPSIHIIVKNGHVTLTGVVSDEGARNLAYVRANGVPGVFSVANDLRVER